MKDDRSIELIHAEIDGVLSGGEQDELAARLDAEPELVVLREELRKLSQTLQQVPSANPPVGLRARILESIRPRPRRSILASLVPSWPAPVALRYAGAAVFGAAVAAVALQIGTMDSADPADVRGLVGTIASYQTPGAPQGTIILNSQGINGSVGTYRQNGLVVLDFDLASDQPMEIIAEYRHSGLSFSGFAQLAGAAASLDAGDGRITFLPGQNHRYAVFFSASDHGSGTIELRFLADEKLVRSEILEVPAMDRK